jgi:hypothetical protein
LQIFDSLSIADFLMFVKHFKISAAYESVLIGSAGGGHFMG